MVVITATLFFAACNVSFNGDSLSGNGNVKTEKRNVGDFHAIKSSGSIDVEVSEGNAYSVSVEDDENILSVIVTEVQGGTLNIHYKDNTSINNDHAKVHVTAPSLDKIISSGSADIVINNVVKNDRQIEISVSGSGNIKGGVDAPEITASIGGSGNVNLSGHTKNFDGKVSGSGDLNCGDLQSENADVSVSGSGNAHVFASVSLKARASGSGDVYYRGNPASPEIHTSGSGSVQSE